MPTYLYETIPTDKNTLPRQFEVFHRMSDKPLKADPKTGLEVKQLITGGIGIKLKGLRRSTLVNKLSPAATACGCATGCGHRH
jgi:predicted nucleic acid-binding Zn ribbon protein